MNKSNILALARQHGLKVLETRVCKRGEIPDDMEYPVITKSISPNIGGWKSDVHICRNREELQKAYEKIEAATVLIQKYIKKKNEYCMEGFSVAQGKDSFIAIVATYNYLLPDYYSPYMTIHNMDNKDLITSLSAMMKDIGFEGIFEIEFLIDQDGTYYFSEINFRNSTWSYAANKAGMPLPVLWAECMLEGFIPSKVYKKVPDGFNAMVEPIDYAKRVKTGKIDAVQWLIDFKQAQCGYYYSFDDIAPFKLMMQNLDRLG